MVLNGLEMMSNKHNNDFNSILHIYPSQQQQLMKKKITILVD